MPQGIAKSQRFCSFQLQSWGSVLKTLLSLARAYDLTLVTPFHHFSGTDSSRVFHFPIQPQNHIQASSSAKSTLFVSKLQYVSTRIHNVDKKMEANSGKTCTCLRKPSECLGYSSDTLCPSFNASLARSCGSIPYSAEADAGLKRSSVESLCEAQSIPHCEYLCLHPGKLA